MRRILLILLLVLATAVGVDAQSIRIGEPIPSVSVSTDLNETLDIYNRDYVCMIFAHSESKPCIDAMSNFRTTALDISDHCAIVVITNENETDSAIIAERLSAEDHILAFDIDNRTFRAFGIHYVPFGVVYSSRNSHIVWFGPIHQLNSKVLSPQRKR